MPCSTTKVHSNSYYCTSSTYIHCTCIYSVLICKQVSSGAWAGEEPATENVEIIHYLDSVRPITTEEAYLSDQFNVATLLTGLEEVEGAREKVVKLATIFKDQEMLTQDAAMSLKKFREAMNSIIQE